MEFIKKSLSQRQLSLIASIYIGLILNAAPLIRNGSAGGWPEAVAATLSAVALIAVSYGLCGFFSLFSTRLYKLLLALVVLVSSGASYYMTFFNVVIGYGVVASTLTLDTDLSTEVLGYKFFVWLMATGLLPGIVLWRTPLTSTLYARRWQGITAFMRGAIPASLALLLLLASTSTIIHLTKAQAQKNNQYTASIGGIIAHSYLPTNWIAGLGIHLYQLTSESDNSRNLFDPAKHFTYRANKSLDDLFVVFVIGETTRWDHMGMLGYQRDTTPLLAQEPNLIAMAGTSCDTTTKLSLRCMFVREGAAENNPQRTVKERNIFAVLHKLGFSSELFAMQSEAWFYSSIDADNYEIREVITSAYAQSKRPLDDMLLVDQLEQSLRKYPQGKHLVVLHTKGSHYLYSQRYPKEFARYKPECMGIDETCGKELLINSFDNSVLYVDYMVKNVIDTLRTKNALVFYTSDHGESIDENNHFHGTPREVAPPEQFRVPMMLWASDKFLSNEANRKSFMHLKARKEQGFTPRHEELFDSILGCIGYASPDGGINPKNNWCSAAD